MLFCWHAPTRKLAVARRGQVLEFLAQVGKLSLFDPFLFTIFLVCLRVVWTSRRGPDGACGFVLEAAAQFGFYMLFVGTMSSLVIGEVMLQAHRRSQQSEERYVRSVIDAISDHRGSCLGESVRSSLASPAESPPMVEDHEQAVSQGRGPTAAVDAPCSPDDAWPVTVRSPSSSFGTAMSLRASASFVAQLGRALERPHTFREGGIDAAPAATHGSLRVATWVAVLSVLPLTAIGICMPAFVFEWGGVVGALKVVIDQPIHVQASVLTIAAGIPFPVDGSVALWVVTCLLVASFAWLVVVAPLLYAFMLLVFWTVPLGPKAQYRCMTLCRTLQAWSALDIFAGALVVAVVGGERFGIAAFVSYVVEQGSLKPVCTALAQNLHVSCLVFNLHARPGLYVLCFCVAAQIIAGQLVRNQVGQLEAPGPE